MDKARSPRLPGLRRVGDLTGRNAVACQEHLRLLKAGDGGSGGSSGGYRVRLLLTGDVHVGRTSSGGMTGMDPALFRAASAWERIVETALEKQVHAVLVSGDWVDHGNRYFEALGVLARGLRRLADQGIRTLAVAGNHDHSVLPALVDSLSGDPPPLTLLGRGGCWESTWLDDGAGLRVEIVGWSFPSGQVDFDPIALFPDRPRGTGGAGPGRGGRDAGPGSTHLRLGLVHGDLDVPGSPYAPIRSDRLRDCAVSGWVLGHVHQPRCLPGAGHPWILYPGSPQALDPGETGIHGAWWIDLGDPRPTLPQRIPLSTLRYERVSLDVTGMSDPDRFRARVAAHLAALGEQWAREGEGILQAAVVDLAVDGSLPVNLAWEKWLDGLQGWLDVDAPIPMAIRGVQVGIRPALDIDALSQGTGLPAVLARFIRRLEAGEVPACAPDARCEPAPGQDWGADSDREWNLFRKRLVEAVGAGGWPLSGPSGGSSTQSILEPQTRRRLALDAARRLLSEWERRANPGSFPVQEDGG
jgi:exonuclease SbcD